MPDDAFGTECHPAPVHLVLTSDNTYQRSIQLSPRKRPQQEDESSTQITRVATASNRIALSEGIQVPRLALAIRLQDNLRISALSADLFLKWLRDLPLVAAQVKVEAGFSSFSSLLIVSIPIALSAHLTVNPAVISLGPVTSSNLILRAPYMHGPRARTFDSGSKSHGGLLGMTQDQHARTGSGKSNHKYTSPSSKCKMDPAAEHPSQSTSSASSVVKGAMGTISSGLLDARPESSSIPSLRGKAKPKDAPGPPTSFLFIVNEQPTNDDPDIPGSVRPRDSHGRYLPPDTSRGFLAQDPGHVYRWTDGVVSEAPGYVWLAQQVGDPPYANGTIYANSTTGVVWPQYYRAATVFYCNHFNKFFTTRGDASARNIIELKSEDSWHPLSFRHENNISYLEHAGDQEFLAVREASWIEQLLPNTYRRHTKEGPANGGLAGLLPIVIALIAFSCRNRYNLYRVLIDDRSWRGHRWVPHQRETGRKCYQ